MKLLKLSSDDAHNSHEALSMSRGNVHGIYTKIQNNTRKRKFNEIQTPPAISCKVSDWFTEKHVFASAHL